MMTTEDLIVAVSIAFNVGLVSGLWLLFGLQKRAAKKASEKTILEMLGFIV